MERRQHETDHWCCKNKIVTEIGGKKFEWDKNRQPKCWKCGQFRYMGKNCRKGCPQGQGIKCYSCGKIGHMAKNCRNKGGNMRFRVIMNKEDEETEGDHETKEQDFPEGSE